MFVGKDEKSGESVALKRINGGVDAAQLQSEAELLKECKSKYIVRYYDVVTNEKEYWV